MILFAEPDTGTGAEPLEEFGSVSVGDSASTDSFPVAVVPPAELGGWRPGSAPADDIFEFWNDELDAS